MRETLQAQIDLAPKLYASEANPDYGQPAYLNLQLESLNRLLNGSPEGEVSYDTGKVADQTGWYDANGKFISPGELKQTASSAAGWKFTPTQNSIWRPLYDSTTSSYVPGAVPTTGAVWRKAGDAFNVTTTRTTPAQKGVNQLLREQATTQRAGDIADVGELGPLARAAMLAANPDNAALLTKLNAQANEGLDAGSMLTADEARQAQQASRAAFAANGLSGSNAAIGDEVFRQFNMGQQLKTQRQAFAQSVLGNNQAVVGDPFQQILGRSSGAMQAAQQSQSQAGPQLFNPMALQNYYAGTYANQVQGAIATPTTYELIGQGFNTMANQVSAVGSMMGGMKCWVAREIYGAADPRWLQFRQWLETCAPAWLDRLYLKHGQRFATWLHDHPRLKPVIKAMMDRALKSGAVEWNPLTPRTV